MEKKDIKQMFCISRFANGILLWGALRNCKYTKEINKEELEKVANEYYDALVEKFWGIENWEDNIEEKYIEEKYRNYTIDELKELIECLYKLYKKYIKNEWCIKLLTAEFVQNWILDVTEEEWKEIKEKIKKDREFQKYLLKIMLEWLENISRNNRYRLSTWISILYKMIWKKLPKIWSLDYYNLWKFEFYEYREKYVDKYLKEKWIDGVLKEVFDEE